MTAYTQAYQAEALERLSKPRHALIYVRVPLHILAAYQDEAERCGIGTPEYMAEVLISKAPLEDHDGR